MWMLVMRYNGDDVTYVTLITLVESQFRSRLAHPECTIHPHPLSVPKSIRPE